MDEGSRRGKGHRLSSPSLSYLADNPPEGCMMAHKQSVNGMGEKEGWTGGGGEGRRGRIEHDSGEAVVNGRVPKVYFMNHI